MFWEDLAKCAERAVFGGSVERNMSYDDPIYRVEVHGSYLHASVCGILRSFVFFLLGFALPLTDATVKLRPSHRIMQSARRLRGNG